MRKNESLRELPLVACTEVVGEARKLCPKCGEVKLLNEFSSRSSSKLQPCSYCRMCQREYCRRHYQDNRDLHNIRRIRRSAGERQLLAQRIYKYKADKMCVDCGERDPVVLEFDHVRGTKKAEIGRMTHTSTWSRIEEEIRKCDVRCANCHRRKTARQLGWKIRGPSAET